MLTGKPAYSGSVPEVHTITTAGRPQSERSREKIRRYLITMGIRTLCFVAAIVTEGWVRWVCVALAAILPLIAVLLANAGGDVRRTGGSMVNASGLPAAEKHGESDDDPTGANR